jgi:hypothetical protein
VDLGVNALEPLAVVFVAVVNQAADHPRPIEARSVVKAARGIRQVDGGVYFPIRDFHFREIGAQAGNGQQSQENRAG